MTLELKKFDPRKIDDACVIVAVGKRRTGKSFLIKDLMYYKKHIPCGVVCSGTEDGNSFYSTIVPEVFVYNHFDREAIERVVERQRKIIKSGGKAHPVFIVLDDLLYDKKFLNDKLVRSLFMNGRHFKICLWLSAQYLVDVPPALRANIDYVFVLRDNLYREKLWRNIFQIFPTLDMFHAAMDSCTADFGALVLDNTNPSTNIADCVFWYKAKDHGKFKMGSPAFWTFAKKHTVADTSLHEEHNHSSDPKENQKRKRLIIKKKA